LKKKTDNTLLSRHWKPVALCFPGRNAWWRKSHRACKCCL